MSSTFFVDPGREAKHRSELFQGEANDRLTSFLIVGILPYLPVEVKEKSAT